MLLVGNGFRQPGISGVRGNGRREHPAHTEELGTIRGEGVYLGRAVLLPEQMAVFKWPQRIGRWCRPELFESELFGHTVGSDPRKQCPVGCGKFGHKPRNIGKELQHTALVSFYPGLSSPGVH